MKTKKKQPVKTYVSIAPMPVPLAVEAQEPEQQAALGA